MIYTNSDTNVLQLLLGNHTCGT